MCILYVWLLWCSDGKKYKWYKEIYQERWNTKPIENKIVTCGQMVNTCLFYKHN